MFGTSSDEFMVARIVSRKLLVERRSRKHTELCVFDEESGIASHGRKCVGRIVVGDSVGLEVDGLDVVEQHDSRNDSDIDSRAWILGAVAAIEQLFGRKFVGCIQRVEESELVVFVGESFVGRDSDVDLGGGEQCGDACVEREHLRMCER